MVAGSRYQQRPTYGTLPAQSRPSITVGAKAGSGADFDPGKVPAAGYVSTLGFTYTDPIAATQQMAYDAAVKSPFSINNPAVVQFLPGVFTRAWASGNPLPVLRMSGRQQVTGSGFRGSRIVDTYNTALAAITTPATTVAWTNPNAFPVIVAIGVNGATMTGTGASAATSPVQVSVGGVNVGLLVPGGAATLAAARSGATWTTFNGTVYVCVGIAQTITLLYSSGTPTLVQYLAMEMFNADPSAQGCHTKNIEYSAPTSPVLWARALDYASDPNNGLAYAETSKHFIVESCFFGGAEFVDNALVMDGCEAGKIDTCQILGGLSWCVPKGQFNIVAGSITKATVVCQQGAVTGTAFQSASTTTGDIGLTVNGACPSLSGDVAQGQNLNNDSVINLQPAYFNGSATGGACVACIVDANATGQPTVFNVAGGNWRETAGTAAAFITTRTTTIVNLLGSQTFNKSTSGTPSIVGSSIGALNIYAGPNGLGPGGTATLAGLLVNAPAGYGGEVLLGVTLQRAETGADNNLLTVIPPAVAGTYRLTFSHNVKTATAAVIGWTATWTDAEGNAQAPTNLDVSEAGSAATAKTITTSAAAGHQDYYGQAVINIDNSATPIIIKTTTGGALTASKASATIEILA
ncbi:MAG: hypothetical protein L3K18_09705 [Thermoplasmata archaeon]|nr:hypothetical protein [Thermoplasmata archaeon]